MIYRSGRNEERLFLTFASSKYRWMPKPALPAESLRCIVSFLAVPGSDKAEERRMIARFLAPHLSIRSGWTGS